uniref:Protease, putative n=1 Tax=Theileria annulata TaxID=5874 RepID=A0A3B0MSF4_THEAN
MNKYGRWLKFVFISVFYCIHLQQCVTIQINILNHNTIPINKTIIPSTNNSILFTNNSIPFTNINSISCKFGSVPYSTINSVPFSSINSVPYNFGRLGFINTNVIKFTKFNRNYNLTECKLVEDKSITHLDKQPTPLQSELKKQPLTTNLSSYVSKFLKNVKESNPYKYLTIKLSKFCVMIFGSALHTLVLSKCRFVLPYQLIPFNSGLGTEVTLDTLISIPILYYILKDYTFTQSTLETNNLKPKLEDNKLKSTLEDNKLKSNLEDNKLTNKSKMVNLNETLDEKYFQLPVRSKFKISMVVTSLLGSFIVSSYFSQFIDSLLLLVSAFDFPISVGMLKSFSVMSSHLFWVFIGSLILKSCMFPIFSKSNPWYKLDLSKLWVYQVLMGYYSSYTIYKLADIGYYLFLKFFDIQNQVSLTDEQISNICETNETIPILITSIGPCLTAPWWEELLYRVFTFKLFNSFLPTLYSSIASSIIFSINHLSPHSFLQLFSLGLLWSFIQLNNDNILITILIHSLWNSRIFFGSLTGI